MLTNVGDDENDGMVMVMVKVRVRVRVCFRFPSHLTRVGDHPRNYIAEVSQISLCSFFACFRVP